MRRFALNQRGFTWHLALPLLAVVGVASIGAYFLSLSHAAGYPSYITVKSNTRECVDNKANKKVAYNVVQIYTCNGGAPQQWVVIASATTAAEIYNVNGYCLNVYNGGKTVGTPVDIYPCRNSAAQQWTVNPTTGAIRNPNSKLCLAYSTPLISTGTPLKLATCNTQALTDQWTVHTPTGSTGGSGGTGTGSGGTGSTGGSGGSNVPYASALSSYKTVAQSYVFNNASTGPSTAAAWAQYGDESGEGGHSCTQSNTSYDSANSAIKLTTTGTGSNCAHIRAPYTSPTKNAVLESEILMPGSSSTNMLDWGSYWTDGADGVDTTNTTGSSNETWPKDGEVDAVETQYGQSYISIHCACRSDYNPSPSSNTSTIWTTEPNGWEGSAATYGTPSGSNIGPVWTVVDIAFTSNGGISIYYNGSLFATVPASDVTPWNTGYMYATWGIGPPGSSGSNWPGGPGSEEVKYFKVFTP